MQNYYNYFTEIEERFQQRRGTLLMLSTLDWALIETWREAGIPLEVVLRGIDDAFDKHDAKTRRATRGRSNKVNGLAWVTQSVMQAAEAAVDAATGMAVKPERRQDGFEAARVAEWLESNAALVEKAGAPGGVNERLLELAGELRAAEGVDLETLDRTLTVLEEKMMAVVLAGTAEGEVTHLREQASRELAQYRAKMGAVQMRAVQQQFVQKRLLEARGLPRLSVFYMPQG